MDSLHTPEIALEQTVSAPAPAAFVTGVWHPEDLVRLDGSPWVLVSAMRSVHGRGALLAIDLRAPAQAIEISWAASAESGRISAAAFDPHGIDARRLAEGRHELLVVDHGGGEAIGRLVLDSRQGAPRAVSGERIVKPVGTSGNAVAFLPDGGFVMTSMFDPRDAATLQHFADAVPTGRVWRWQTDAGWQALGPDLSGANGIAVTPDGEALFVSEWAAQRLWKLTLDGEVLAHQTVDFLPDNLRWTTNGHLLLAGQRDRPERVFGCEARGEACPMGFSAVQVDPATLALRTLLRFDHAQATAIGFGGATGALRIEDELWVASFTGTRIARFAVR